LKPDEELMTHIYSGSRLGPGQRPQWSWYCHMGIILHPRHNQMGIILHPTRHFLRIILHPTRHFNSVIHHY